MLKIINKKNNFIVIISSTIILVGFCCVAWSLNNENGYSIYHIENKVLTINPEKEVIDILKYKAHPSKGDYIGTINIPILNKTFPIYEGTSNDVLKKGVGHFIESVLPGLNDNSVLSAHREKQFKEIEKLKIGDIIIINVELEEFIYEVIDTKIVNKNDKSIIVPTEEATLTLTTCYPFNSGSAPDRYIVSSKLLTSK